MTTAATNRQLRFVEIRSELVKQLPGFEKHHRLPGSASEHDQAWVARWSEPLLDEDLQAVFSALRKAYGLKRREISVDGPFEGQGIVETPFFKYRIEARLDPEQLTRVELVRSIYDIEELARVLAGPFDDVFGRRFSTLELATSAPLNLESIVDAIEDLESETVQVDYDKDLTWCEIQLLESTGSVVIEPQAIRVTATGDASPRQLLESLLDIQNRFIADLNLATGELPD